MKKIITYKDAGVDIDKASRLVKKIKSAVKGTRRQGVVAGIGSFGGLFGIDNKRFKEPVLVSSTDGVGTKIMIAQRVNKHRTVGIDLVAMCANDVATTGARPLFFLDYISCGKIKDRVIKDLVYGISQACRETGYALVGGETAEMPGIYGENEYDLAGFCVGIVERSRILDGRRIKIGDKALGLASSGLHSNGFSLVRKLFSEKEQNKRYKEFLRPTRLYVKPLLSLGKRFDVKGIAHITGGAFIDKIPRIIPKGMAINIYRKSWPLPKIFKEIKGRANLPDSQMYKTFNMGVGMVVVLPKGDINKAKRHLLRFGIKAWLIGEVVKGKGKVNLI